MMMMMMMMMVLNTVVGIIYDNISTSIVIIGCQANNDTHTETVRIQLKSYCIVDNLQMISSLQCDSFLSAVTSKPV